MKNSKIKKILLMFFMLNVVAYADNEPNNICSSQAEVIKELEGIRVNIDIKELGIVHKSKDEYDIYKFKVGKKGKLKITVRGKSTKYSFFVGTSCSKYKDIYSNTKNKTKKDVDEFDVSKDQIIYLKVQRRYNRWMKYDINIRFQPEAGEPPVPTNNKFILKYITSLKGNLKVIGNTVLFGDQSSSNSNANLNLSYIDVDNEKDTFNSSRAKIRDVENGIRIKDGEIIWAGLYWQGYLHSNDGDTGIDNQFNFDNGKDDKERMISTINNQIVNLKLKTGESFNFKPEDIYIDQNYDEKDYISYKYAAFKNVTDQLKGLSPTNEYTVSNIVTRSGKTSSGSNYDGLGNYGAWALVVVYKNEEESLEKMRNISVFNGYEILSKDYNPRTRITLEGFRTPKYTPSGVDSTISIFAGEGDKYILGDSAKLINEKGLVYNLPNATGTDSYFASSIEGVPERTPKLSNNNGIDIHTTEVGSSKGADKPIKENQTKAYLEMETTQDTFMPSMVAFGTELFVPKLCYDYSLGLGDEIKIPSKGRIFDTASYGKDLNIKILIRSQEGDFSFSNATVKIEFTPEDKTITDSVMTYKTNSSLVSPPFVNAYIPVPDQTTLGEVAIGKLNKDKSSGIIDSLESSYLKQKYIFNKGSFKGKFDIRLKGEIKFDGVDEPVNYDLTTKDGSGRLTECLTNKAYNPVWGEYNIERKLFLKNEPDEVKYPLYTQVAGKDYSVYLRRYAYNKITKKFDIPIKIYGNIEVEIIDAGLFDNNENAGYDSSCEEPDRIGGTMFLTMGSQGKPQFYKKINIPQDISDFDNKKALKNIAFRMWFLATYDEKDRFKIIDHTCFPSIENNCFKDLYTNYFKTNDIGSLCKKDCSTNYSSATCYNCLKINFAKPICSRDNFSVKPASFRINISDNQEGEDKENEIKLITNNTEEEITLAAGYNYNLNIESKLYESENMAKGYYKNNFKAEKLTTLDDINEYIGLESQNKEKCFDKQHYTYTYTFIDGKIYENSLFKHINVGEYDFSIEDSTWTEVDQASYKYKNTFNGIKTNDCIVDNDKSSGSSFEKVGCNISSKIDTDHTKIKIKFNPYAFSLEDVEMATTPEGKNKIFMNDFSSSVYSEGSLYMGAVVKGDIIAEEKGGTITTNYTDECYAEDISLDISRITTPVEEEYLVSKKGFGITKKVEFQQYLDQIYAEDILEEGQNKKVSLSKEEFKIEEPGKAPIKLYLTFKKPIDSVISPIRTMFKKINVDAENAKSNANKINDYIPEGEKEFNKEIDYFFGKVTPYRKLYGPTRDPKVDTPVYVDIFCEDSSISCSEFGLFNQTKGQDENLLVWYNAKDIFENSDLGTIDLYASTILGKDGEAKAYDKVKNKTKGITFDDDFASEEDIDVILLGSDRPSVVEVKIKPSPWLIYDEYDVLGYPTYRVKFIGRSVWIGVGETGDVIDSEASVVPNRRMHW